jgi:hypothetical protein
MHTRMWKFGGLSFVDERKLWGMVGCWTFMFEVWRESKRWIELRARGGIIDIGRHCPSLSEDR